MSLTLLTGGVRSGKSRWAEHLLRERADVTYVATALPPEAPDPEWQRRVAAHRSRRPAEWRTVETLDLLPLLLDEGGPLLVECLGTWLTGIVDDAGAWEDLHLAGEVVRERGAGLVAALSRTRRDVVIVSNEVGLSLVPPTPSGRFFQEQLGRLTEQVADVAHRVALVVAGRLLDLSQAERLPVLAPLPTPQAGAASSPPAR